MATIRNETYSLIEKIPDDYIYWLNELIKKFIALITQSSIVITYPDTLFKWPHCFVLMILLFQRLVNLLCKDLIASYEARRRR